MNSDPFSMPLIMEGDLPASQMAGMIQSVDSPGILLNVGDALNYLVQSIVLRDKPNHLSGTVRLYFYPDSAKAMSFYERLTKTRESHTPIDLGDEALINTTAHLLGFPDSTTTVIRFRRERAVVEIVGSFQPDPSFSQGYLTRDDVVAHARRLDQRLVQAFAQTT